MPNITNRNGSGRLEPGVVLTVTGAESENEAILAVENYLRENKKEDLEITVQEGGDSGSFDIALQ